MNDFATFATFAILLLGGMAFGNLLFRLLGGTRKRDELRKQVADLEAKVMHQRRQQRLDAERKAKNEND